MTRRNYHEKNGEFIVSTKDGLFAVKITDNLRKRLPEGCECRIYPTLDENRKPSGHIVFGGTSECPIHGVKAS